MSIRSKRSLVSRSASLKMQKLRREKQLRQSTKRDMRVESLEDRRLMAGLQLVGIATNQGGLLNEGLVFNVPPKELVFRFNDGAVLDSARLGSGIEILRSGGDGTFEVAAVRSDLNTNGAVLMEFAAVDAGSAGDGITLVFSKNARGLNGGVGVTVQGAQIKVDLNTTNGAHSTAADLRNAINSHPEASQLVKANVIRGNAFTDISFPNINYSPLILANANQAKASSNFNQGPTVEIEFTAVPSGVLGNGIQLTFSQRDFGGAGAPIVTVNGRNVHVELNNRPGSESTAGALVGAINASVEASSLVRARQVAGRSTSRVTSSQALLPLTLQGASDLTVTPGFVGLGEATNIGVVRFSETLIDDHYLVNVLARPGSGRLPVADIGGVVLNDGQANRDVHFELDLGAQVLSVVPQPITRNAGGQLVQARNQIHVYFNDDDLHRTDAENPNFYELIATSDTVRNTDDLSFHPVQVQYDAALDRAVLTFASNLEDLMGGGGTTFRLRIGTDEALPLAPVVINPGVEIGSSFNTAFDLSGSFETGAVLLVHGDGQSIVDGHTLTVTSKLGSIALEFENTVDGPTGVGSGREPIFFTPGSSADQIAAAIADAINAASTNAGLTISAVAAGNQVFIDNDERVILDPRITAISKASQGTIVSGSISNVGQPYNLQFPGANNEPGHREIPVENHLLIGPDGTSGITVARYNFQDDYGFDPLGNPLRNAITEIQKQRVREIYQLYGNYFGIQFVETLFQGMTIAVGDVRAVDPTAQTGPGNVLGIAEGGLTGRLVMDLADFDFQNDGLGEEFFRVAMHEIGHLLGLGHATEQPALTIMSGLSQPVTATAEPVSPGDNDIVHGKLLYRPESKDIDLYRFEVAQTGLFTAETIAERQANSSLLDTSLTLYRETLEGRTVVARNDDYFSKDSHMELLLEPGVYFLGVSASGNSDYDPNIVDSGIGGLSEGAYQLRMNFRGEATNGITDADNRATPGAADTSRATLLDGDADGVPGGVFNFWFRAQDAANTIYVDKSAATSGANGSLARPFNNIGRALNEATAGDIVRIVGNGGADGDITTLNDNLAYEIGFSALNGRVLADGSTLEVPKGVTVMVDDGAIIKSRRARINVGTSAPSTDRSGGALQVLGVPRRIENGVVRRDALGQPIVSNVIFTSLHDTIGITTNPDRTPPPAAPGDWGGLSFRADLDHRDLNRLNYEKQGIFLNSVVYADIRFGGGNVTVNGVPTIVDPIYIADSRPTIGYNTITRSAHAAISANPNSFEETNFHSPEYQIAGAFTSDYARLGPDVHGNRVLDNTLNGMFVRIRTAAGAPPEQLTVAARFDDTDMVHVLQENLTVAGTPGGPQLESVAPPIVLVTVQPGIVGGILPPGTYNYRLTFVDASGTEGPASDISASATIPGNPDAGNNLNIGTVQLGNLPTLSVFPNFSARRLYRSSPTGTGPYTLVAQLNATDERYLDTGVTIGGTLGAGVQVIRSRLDARLRLDPGLILKSEAAVVELGMGANFIAEGVDGDRVVMTSLADSRYGAGGTYNTNSLGGAVQAEPGDWGGIYAGNTSRLNMDFALIANAGGVVRLEGDFRTFNALEIHQASARVANTIFELNATGFVPADNNPDSLDPRFGRGFNRDGVLFIRGAQPVIVKNTFRNNTSGAVQVIDRKLSAISINVNSLNSDLVNDLGRATGAADIYNKVFGNQGPLISGNMLINNDLNGMTVRHGTLTTEGVWDDTDIVHIVNGSIDVTNLHTVGGLRLVSKATESLVVKLSGADAGFTALGKPLDIDDRIGGSVQIIGHPRHPVVLTALSDCTVGAGFTPDGTPQTDTQNSGGCGPLVVERSPFVDVIVVMDESGSMGFAQVFSIQLIADLDAALIASGIGDGSRGGFNLFGLVGYGDANTVARSVPVGANGALFGTSVEYGIAAQTLTSTGATEDGYQAIHFTIDNYQFRPDAAKFVILVTNEDRDIVDANSTFANTLAKIQASGAILEGILSVNIADVNGSPALAIDAQSNTYLEDGQGGFTVTAGGSINSFDTSVQDYANMVFATGGIVGDIDQISAGGNTTTSFSRVIIGGIKGQVGVIGAGPGDWRSVRLESYSHDRNVDAVSEIEPFDSLIEERNGNIARSEFLGDLAPHEKGGDDNLRLGFVVHGAINNPQDVDVYRFTAEAGTEVWLDIDRTTHSLDTVLELITADGEVLARSNNAVDETLNPSLILRHPTVPANHINVLGKSPYDGFDRFTTNPRDAGMRIQLPGAAGQRATYYVRVRSAGEDLNDVDAGLTRGVYELQVRLRETDEWPGSLIRSADIRYATTGVEVFGQPIHSPLLGEVREDATSNNTAASAQAMGNYLATDRSALAIGGNLSSASDIDFYSFDARYVDVQQQASPTNPQYISTTFDMDYTDGLGRPNTSLWVFDQNGNLVLTAGNGNVAEDQPGPLAGANMDDLTRGSAGVLDPFLGKVELPVGSYRAAVTNTTQVPAELGQFYFPNPTNPRLRLEPLNSLVRIAEDHIESSGGSTAAPPVIPVMIDNDSFVPWNLGDMALYVSIDPPGPSNTLIAIVNPMTGQGLGVVGGFNENTGDLAFRPGGDLMTFNIDDTFPRDDTTTGRYFQINHGTAAITEIGQSDITTWEQDPTDPLTAVQSNHGMDFEAFAFGNPGDGIEIGLGVAHRLDGATPLGIPLRRNVLYQFVPSDVNDTAGEAISGPANDRSTDAELLDPTGAGTQKVERGVLDTDAEPGAPGGDINGIAFVGNDLYGVSSRGGLYRIENYTVPRGAFADWVNTSTDLLGIQFSGLTAGPRNLEDGRFGDILFGMTSAGRIFAFNTDGELQPVFANGATSVQINLPVIGERHGLAFSTLDTNLWHVTDSRAADAGHGLTQPFDGSRTSTAGGSSVWFAYESQTANDFFVPDPFHEPGTSRDYEFPGGAHGELITNEFSLEGYSPHDQPTLYFNYHLNTENSNGILGNSAPPFVRDTFRVYVAGDDGQFHLLATNNSAKGPDPLDDEYDDHSGLGFEVQQLFDVGDGGAPDSWRQARLDLSHFAGQKSIKVRFEFHTAGAFDVGSVLTTGDYVFAIAGRDLRDGQRVVVDTDTFEFDLGATLVAPTGRDVNEAETFTIDGNTFEFDKNNDGVSGANISIPVNSTQTAEEVAQAMETAILTVGGVIPRRHDNRIQLDGALVVTQSAGAATVIDGRAGVTAGTRPMVVHADMTASEVALVVQKALADRYAGGEIGAFPTHEERVQVVRHTVNNRGPLGLTSSLTGDQFGSYSASARSDGSFDQSSPGTLGARNNNHEGVYIDDIVVGFAERGEMATAAANNTNFISNPTAPANQILVGDYQLEIRRGEEYGIAVPPPVPTLILTESADTNDRNVQQHTIQAPGAHEIIDGQTFSIYDGINTVTFEYEDVNIGNGVGQGRIPIAFDPSAPDGRGGVSPESSIVMARRIRNAINSIAVQAVLDVRAGFSDGEVTGGTSTDDKINLYGNAIVNGITNTRFDSFGDQNLFRDQGQFIISSSKISRSLELGINVDTTRDGPEGNPHHGPTRTTRELNSQRLTTGLVIENNIIYNNGTGGIRVSGNINGAGQQVASVPFARIVNNTLFGERNADTGILIENNASPTLLNNIVSNFDLGLAIDATSASTVIGGMLYKENLVDSNTTLGNFAITLGRDDPLFVNPTRENFYLAPGSLAIDSSINSLNDRPAIVSVRGPLGIPVSPILAPERDALGQLRVDDPSIEPPAGAGENVFVDRGAIDHADFAGPTAALLDPRDNDANGRDLDPRETFVKLSVISQTGFSIQLLDGVEPIDPINGAGLDDSTVTKEQLVLLRDGVRLVEGVDYRFRYDQLNDVIRLTPIAGIFETNHYYVIELANRDQFVITAPAGDEILDGDSFTVADESGNTAEFEYESGYTITVAPTLTLIMPQSGGGLGGMTDRQIFTVTDGTKLVTFEFDNNGSVAAGRIPVVFTPQTSSEQLAQAVIDALILADVGVAPVDLGNGQVHVGATPVHIVDITGARSLRRTGSETGGVFDGDRFTLDDGVRRQTFEFDFDGTRGSNTIAINLLQQDTHLVIADRIVDAIRTNTILTPVHLGDGFIHLGGNLLTVLDASASQLTQFGAPGVRPEFGIRIPSTAGRPVGIADGQTFRIGDGVQLPVTFEFDTNGRVVPGNTIVTIPLGATLDQIANAMVQAIASVGIGLTPTNAGQGRVILNGDTAQHFFQRLTSPLQGLGTPGVDGAVQVKFVPDDSFTGTQMAALISQLINANQKLQDVSATTRDDQIIVEGVSDVTGIVQAFVEGIRDVAGHVLRANQETGETRFTIQLASGLDFGDAPSLLKYPTLNAQNGARHVIDPSFTLGASVDIDVDGQPASAADGDDNDGVDDEDGVTFTTVSRGYKSTMTVNVNGVSPTRTGFIDAFIDWNRDGDWNDAGEKIVDSQLVVNGGNVFELNPPTNASVGPTFARIRLSSTGGLGPLGAAADGEVEDHRVLINASPWQNFARPADVNGDNRVQPFDVLQIVSFLNKYGTQTLPVPPPFIAANGDTIFPNGRMIDVDGNTRIEPFDALIVVNAIRTGNGEGEDQAEGEGVTLSAAAKSAAALNAWPAPVLVTNTVSVSAAESLSTPRSAKAVREVTFRLPPAASTSEYAGDRLATSGTSFDDLLDAIVVDNSGDEQTRAVDEVFASLEGN